MRRNAQILGLFFLQQCDGAVGTNANDVIEMFVMRLFLAIAFRAMDKEFLNECV